MNHPESSAYVEAYAAARSCLGALADLSDFDESCRYERLLIDLDGIHEISRGAGHDASKMSRALRRHHTWAARSAPRSRSH